MSNTPSKNGIILRFPFSLKKTKISDFRINFPQFCYQKIKECSKLGYKCFIFELVEEDFKILDFTIDNQSLIEIKKVIRDEYRIAIYIKSKKNLTSDFPDDINTAIDEVKKCLSFIGNLDGHPQLNPVIVHVGGAKGDRRNTMDRFCTTLQDNFTNEEIKRLAVINDDKPSLFSVKDLLPGVFYKLKLPIIFRSTSYPTNQGNLTLNESLFLAASTWDRLINPIFIYLPEENKVLEDNQTSPFGLQLDIIFDNRIPEPK